MWLYCIINYKRVQTSSAMSTHVRCFWDGLKKPLQNHHEGNQSVVPWCLWHRCRSIPDSDAWSFHWSSTSQPVPSRMQLCKAALRFHTTTSTHLGTKSTAPQPLHCHIADCIPNWCQRACNLTSRLWLRPDQREIQFWCLLERRKILCFDLRVFGLKRFFKEVVSIHKSKQVQNSWRSHDAKIEMS